MRRIPVQHIILFLFSFWLGKNECCIAQNLVPNPSFEVYDTCPYTNYQINFAAPWFSPSGARSTFLNSCNSDTVWSVPKNNGGYQYARTGNGYLSFGSQIYNGEIVNSEYLSAKLLDSLDSNSRYLVSFWLSSCDKVRYGIDRVGAYFSNDSIPFIPSILPITLNPQIQNPTGNVILDTMNWVLVQDTLIAHGGERYITIGTFLTDSVLHIDSMPGVIPPYAGYYIDDISVVELPSGVGGADHSNSFKANVYPNPADEYIQIVYSETRRNSSTFRLMNLLGKTVIEHEIETKSGIHTLNTSSLPAGIYFYEINVDYLTSSKGKLVIVH